MGLEYCRDEHVELLKKRQKKPKTNVAKIKFDLAHLSEKRFILHKGYQAHKQLYQEQRRKIKNVPF